MKRFFLLIALLSLLFTGCNLPSAKDVISQVQEPDLNAVLTEIAPTYALTMEALPTAEPTPTQKPAETLTVCLGQEPETLFIYAGASSAMKTILETVYDGPFDLQDGKEIPVIFDAVEVSEEAVPVKKDSVVYDADGNITAVTAGTKLDTLDPLRDCGYAGCQVSWMSGMEGLQMRQTVITFRLKEGLKWSDGEPLTAEDSVYSMNVNGMKEIKASRTMLHLTESYTAEDAHTLVWRGIPGYVPQTASDCFWTPLPKHTMMGMSAQELLADDTVNRSPLGWGAYVITGWTDGEELTAERNPFYRSADGSEPFFDRVVFRFYGKAGDNNLQALRSGTCNIVDTSADLRPDLEPILEDVRDGKLSAYIRPSLVYQQLTFGIDSLKEGRQRGYNDYFSSAGVRKALTQCIDRNALIRQVVYGQSEIPTDFYPADHADHVSGPETIAYDPTAGAAALEELGWKDDDGDPATARVAQGAQGAAYGTKFELSLSYPDTAQGRKAAEMIREDLAGCGVSLTLDPQDLGTLYGQGPKGTLFGRKFDLALFAWSSASGNPCGLYHSSQIPTESNHWIGTNVGGFASSAYDEACSAARDEGVFRDGNAAYEQAAEAYASLLPAVPLWFDPVIAVSDNFTCGLEMHTGERSLLWNIESLSRSDTPCAVSQWKDIYQ